MSRLAVTQITTSRRIQPC